jgi:branched-chain amino acid transport system permease protein
MAAFLASFGFGLVTASVLAIAAVGFTLQFGVTDVLNLAYGAVMIAGAFIAYVVNSAGLSVWIGLVVAVVACAAGSVLLNAGVYAPFQRRGTSPITMVIVSLGMTLIIEFGVQAAAGGTSVSYAMNSGPSVRADGLLLSAVQLAVIGLSVLVMAGTHVLLRYTKLGKAMRATAQDPEAARLMGINVDTTISLTFLLGGMLAGAAGLIYALYQTTIWYFQGFTGGLIAFTAAVMGGIGNLRGAVLGGIIIGLLENIAQYIDSEYLHWGNLYEIAPFYVLIIILMIKPYGLFGTKDIERV